MLAARDRIRLGQAAREVEREIQTAEVARGRQVAADARALQLSGGRRVPRRRIDRHGGALRSPPTPRPTAAAARCYPYPPADLDPNTRPNLDGPVRTLDSTVTFSVVADDRVPPRWHRLSGSGRRRSLRADPDRPASTSASPERPDAHHHGQWPWQSAAAIAPRSNEAGFSLPETMVATLLLATAVVSVAQLFVLATRANLSAQRQTYASTLAQEKMEQLRGLAWGFDDVGLPISDYSTDLAVDPPDPDDGVGLSPSPGNALAANVDGYVDYLDRYGRSLGGGETRPGQHRLRAPLVGRAAADQSEQHADPAGARLQRRRSSGHRRRRCSTTARDEATARERQDEEGAMTVTTVIGERGFTLVELLISMVVMVGITGAIFALVDPARGTFRQQPEVADMQQRLRVGTSYPHIGSDHGRRRRSGRRRADGLADELLRADPAVAARHDRLRSRRRRALSRRTPSPSCTSRRTRRTRPSREPMPQPSSELKVDEQPNCPVDVAALRLPRRAARHHLRRRPARSTTSPSRRCRRRRCTCSTTSRSRATRCRSATTIGAADRRDRTAHTIYLERGDQPVDGLRRRSARRGDRRQRRRPALRVLRRSAPAVPAEAGHRSRRARGRPTVRSRRRSARRRSDSPPGSTGPARTASSKSMPAPACRCRGSPTSRRTRRRS